MIGELAARTFSLSPVFLDRYRGLEPAWGPLGLVTFLRTYSRMVEEGHKESYTDTLQRCVEGCFSIQKNHCHLHGLPWSDEKAQRTAQRMFQAMWEFKFLPAGRGLWTMGTEHIIKCGGASLNNCGMVSTKDLRNDPTKPFTFLMDMMMVGVGVGFDVMGAGQVMVREPRSTTAPLVFTVEDSRAGWVDSTRILLETYLVEHRSNVHVFDYSKIRPAGVPLKLFGGVSSGPRPLIDLHQRLIDVLKSRIGHLLSSTDILDIMNLIGLCVNSGNIRRGAEIALGGSDDREFLDAKRDHQAYPHRSMSNNSVLATIGQSYTDIGWRTAINGEPGYFWLENARAYGRMKDGITNRDHLVVGTNPCSEQSLENYELCNLVESFPARHASLREYLDTLKLAYMWAKTVSLLPTHIKETNAVTLRNRRIGCSQSGITGAFARHGRREVLRWCDEAYAYVVGLDKQYSSWLCVPESIKKTSVKPSGTVSLLPGETPGIHYPHAEHYIRRIRIASNDPLVMVLAQAGYSTEPDDVVPETVVVSFPVKEPYFERGKDQVSMWEQLENVAAYQHYWADNQVSATVTFRDHEQADIPKALELYESRLKSIAFLPADNHGYRQAPYQTISQCEYDLLMRRVTRPLDYRLLTDGEGTRFCDNDKCQS